MSTNWAKLIADQYEQTLAAQKAQLQSQYEQNASGYQKKLKDAVSQYQTLKNEAYVNNALAEKARQESVANMGLSGEGGTSQTLRQKNAALLLADLSDAALKQQEVTNDVNLSLDSLGKEYSADVSDLESQAATQRNKALIEQSRWQAGYDMDAQKMARAQQESVFEQAYSLYLKRLITAAQFEAMTGISLRK